MTDKYERLLMDVLFAPDVTRTLAADIRPVAFFVLFGLGVLNARFVCALLHVRGRVRGLLCGALWFTVQAVLVTTVLGLFGALNYTTLVAVLLATAGALSVARLRSGNIRPPETQPGQGADQGLRGPAVIALGVAAAAMAGAMFVWAVITPPPASDAFIYHLTLPTQWMQRGSIIPWGTDPFGAVFHPSNPETLMLWLLLPFHEDILSNLLSWSFWLLNAAAVFALARAFTRNSRTAFFAAMLWLIVPQAAQAATSSEADLFATFFFLLTLCFLVDYMREPGTGAALHGGLALGVFFGSKLLALVFGLAPALLFVYAIRSRSISRRRHMAVFASAALVPAIVWYAYNALAVGNPFYPWNATVFGHTLLPGYISRHVIMSAPDLHAPGAAGLLSVLAGLFGALGFVLVPAAAAALAARREGRDAVARIIFLLPFAMVLFFAWGLGLNRDNSARYLFPAVALSCVAWAVCLPARRPARGLVLAATAAAVLVTLAHGHYVVRIVIPQVLQTLADRAAIADMAAPARWIAVCAGLGAAGLGFLATASHARPRRMAALLLAGSLAVFAACFPMLSSYYSHAKYHWYLPAQTGHAQAWNAINRLSPEPVRVAVCGTNNYHGFHGVMLGNIVYDAAAFSGSAEDFLAGLSSRKVDFVVTHRTPFDSLGRAMPGPAPFAPQEQFIQSHAHRFRLIADFGSARIYAFLNSSVNPE